MIVIPKSLLNKTITCFDIETTSIYSKSCQTVQFSAIKIKNGEEQEYNWFVKPTKSITKESTLVHGITSETVKNCPSFQELRKPILDALDSDLICGYNIIRFDIHVIRRQFGELGYNDIFKGKSIYDGFYATKNLHHRDLRSVHLAYGFKPIFIKKHDARTDCRAALDICLKQLSSSENRDNIEFQHNDLDRNKALQIVERYKADVTKFLKKREGNHV